MAKAKTVNYTPEMVARMEAVYSPDAPLADREAAVALLVTEFGKNKRSIVAKLSTMGIYNKPEASGKKGGVKKTDLVNAIVAAVPMADNDADSLGKATMNALRAVMAAVTASASEDGEAAEDSAGAS